MSNTPSSPPDQGDTINRHDSFVTALAYSPDGAYAASGSYDATVIIYDARTTVFAKAALFKLQGHAGEVSALAFSPDSRRLASASWEDAQLIVWDVDGGRAVHQVYSAEAICTLAYTPDGTMLLSGGTNGSLTIWSTDTYQAKRTITAHDGCINVLVLSPDGRFMLTGGSSSSQSLLWDLSTLQPQHEGPPHVRSLPHEHATICAAFSPDGRRVATASDDRTSPIIIWDASTGAELVRLNGFPRSVSVSSFAFAPDGGRIVSGSMDSMVRIHDAGSGAHNMSLGKHRDSVYAVAFSPAGGLVASAGADCTVRLWDVTGEQGRLARTFRGHTGRVMGVLFSPDGGTVLSGSVDGTARLESTVVGVDEYEEPERPSVKVLIRCFEKGAVTGLAYSCRVCIADGRNLTAVGTLCAMALRALPPLLRRYHKKRYFR